jgi:hypothetical protein
MFCPQCKYEYRPGFTHCPDCDVDLVDSLDSSHTNAPHSVPDSHSSRTIWTGERDTDCVAFCRELRDIGIAYKVSQTEVSRSVRMGIVWRYEIAIASTDYEKAKELLQLEDDPASGNDSVISELSEDHLTDDVADGGPEVDPEDVESEAASAERRVYSEDWYAEDATAEVWTQSAGPKGNPLGLDATSMVELSLRENFIHFRSDRDEKGVCRIFVMPEDEARAREIVREIEDSSPRK